MNRSGIKHWLNQRAKTWRWNQDNVDSYSSLECNGSDLVYANWSHDMEHGGQAIIGRQTVESFLSHGAAHPIPSEIESAIRDWLNDTPLSADPPPH